VQCVTMEESPFTCSGTIKLGYESCICEVMMGSQSLLGGFRWGQPQWREGSDWSHKTGSHEREVRVCSHVRHARGRARRPHWSAGQGQWAQGAGRQSCRIADLPDLLLVHSIKLHMPKLPVEHNFGAVLNLSLHSPDHLTIHGLSSCSHLFLQLLHSGPTNRGIR